MQKKWDSIFKVKVTVGLYNQNMTVSTVSFISSKPVSLLQPNSIWMQIIISKEVSSENVWIAVFKVNVTAKVKSFT